MRLVASPFLWIGSVAVAFGIACSGTSYTTKDDENPGVGGSGEAGGDGDGGNASSTGGSDGSGDGGASSGGADATGGVTGTGGDSGTGGDTGTGGDEGTGGAPGVGGTGTGGIGTGGVGTGGIGTGGVGTGGIGTGGMGTGGYGTGGNGGSTGGSTGTGGAGGGGKCPVAQYFCPLPPVETTAAPIGNNCAALQQTFEDALVKARACSSTPQCTGSNVLEDSCGCPHVLNDDRCDLVDAARYAHFVWTVCNGCPQPLCLNIIGCDVGVEARPYCSSDTGMCEYKYGHATE